ncbi:MAG: 1-(5-phosphoribosyl)-5-[(5-phosphoribosylamino)methylideneamino] imidazole-4-carboxamide isomerase [Deltaproteobacteria bacterium DG_8]|nr:MAG: 1-(5-phosphoribosyl)-5-[(5-phosphoribosylamino)methylideneamino] imidazole-4-carboxamide isomerase [Deltaproteobacteria bacterium DG_8]
MQIIPAIDLKGGYCVRLEQGEMSRETIFSPHPAEVARHWESLGSKMLHIVDLEGAFTGKPQNQDAIYQILRSVAIPLQLGGGIRNLNTIEHYLSLGVKQVVLGTIAYQQPSLLKEACQKFPHQIVVSVDARDGKIAIKGWSETIAERATDLVKGLEDKGVEAIVFTDIKRDGMMSGPNVKSIKELAEATHIPLIASGGVTTLNHIKELVKLEDCGVEGIIIGRALYEGSIDLRKALALVSGRK